MRRDVWIPLSCSLASGGIIVSLAYAPFGMSLLLLGAVFLLGALLQVMMLWLASN